MSVSLTDKEAKTVAMALDEWLDLVEHDKKDGDVIETVIVKIRKGHPYFN